MVGKASEEVEPATTPLRRSTRKRPHEDTPPGKDRNDTNSMTSSTDANSSIASSTGPNSSIVNRSSSAEQTQESKEANQSGQSEDMSTAANDVSASPRNSDNADAGKSAKDGEDGQLEMDPEDGQIDVDPQVADDDQLSLTGNPDSDQDIEDCEPSNNRGSEMVTPGDDDDDVFILESQGNQPVAVPRSNLPGDVIIPDLRRSLDTSIIAQTQSNGANQDDDEIYLSGDEENNNEEDDVTLVCLKRPLLLEVPNQEDVIEILESDEEFPVCVEKETFEAVDLEEKAGYVKEFIENEGIALIASETYGLVLFHLKNVFIDGEQHDPTIIRQKLPLGSPVKFYDREYTGPEYKILSNDECINQAVVVWKGDRPRHLIKFVEKMDDQFWNSLEEHRNTFLLFLRGEVFLPLAFNRVKGRIEGYLTQDVGVIKVVDDEDRPQLVIFHADHAWIFRKTIEEIGAPPKICLPVGLNVSVDARRIHIPGVENIKYQAVIVLAGSWPQVPQATLIPGGPGTMSGASMEAPEGKGTYYYLELSLETRLKNKVNELRAQLPNAGCLNYLWEDVNVIKSGSDMLSWRGYYGGSRSVKPYGQRKEYRKKIAHTFKAPPIRRFKTKEEMDDGSMVGNTGSSAASLVSGVSSFGSRNQSRLSDYSYSSSASQYSAPKFSRNWYGADQSIAGALRLKKEVKEEPDSGGGGEYSIPNKRVKLENDN